MTLCVRSEQDLDRANKAILLPDGSVVPYDTLILCTGRYANSVDLHHFKHCAIMLFYFVIGGLLKFA
jgi:NADH dehydrogenase FAD-containing subunit